MSLPSLRSLVEAVTEPASVVRLSLAQWDLLIRQGRASDSLARLGGRIEAAGLDDEVPPEVLRHLKAAQLLAQRQHTELAHEVRAIAQALAPEGIALVLLKGAAYAQAGLGVAVGRMVSGVDILVPRDRLADAESALMKAGWLTTTRDAYDQRYYRTWMHEIPALRHFQRGSVMDVHHAVVPPTAGYAIDSRWLLEASVALDRQEHVRVLSDVDMVLHSAVHLKHEGELELGFRGLLDLDALLGEFGVRVDFWARLLSRAEHLGVQYPAYLALRYTSRLIGTAIPTDVLAGLRGGSKGLNDARLAMLDFLYERSLRPDHPSLSDRWTPLARQVLYLRAHALRMPVHLLLPHLLRKSFRRLAETIKKREEVADAAA